MIVCSYLCDMEVLSDPSYRGEELPSTLCNSGTEKEADVVEAELAPFSHEYSGALSGQRLGRSDSRYQDSEFHRFHHRTGCLFQSESERIPPTS